MDTGQHKALLNEVLHHAPLVHPASTSHRDAPIISPDVKLQPYDKKPLLEEIAHGVPLHHVDDAERHDASRPKVEDIVLHQNNRDELLSEIRAAGGHHAVVTELKHTFLTEAHEGGLPLHHVNTVDKSVPAVEGAHVGQWDKAGFLKEVRDPHWLNTVPPEEVHDRSAPQVPPQASEIDGTVGVVMRAGGSPAVVRGAAAHAALLKQVEAAGGAAALHPVPADAECGGDRSSPVVTKTAAMRVLGGPSPTHGVH